jgi:hypothetical protein
LLRHCPLAPAMAAAVISRLAQAFIEQAHHWIEQV